MLLLQGRRRKASSPLCSPPGKRPSPDSGRGGSSLGDALPAPSALSAEGDGASLGNALPAPSAGGPSPAPSALSAEADGASLGNALPASSADGAPAASLLGPNADIVNPDDCNAQHHLARCDNTLMVQDAMDKVFERKRPGHTFDKTEFAHVFNVVHFNTTKQWHSTYYLPKVDLLREHAARVLMMSPTLANLYVAMTLRTPAFLQTVCASMKPLNVPDAATRVYWDLDGFVRVPARDTPAYATFTNKVLAAESHEALHRALRESIRQFTTCAFQSILLRRQHFLSSHGGTVVKLSFHFVVDYYLTPADKKLLYETVKASHAFQDSIVRVLGLQDGIEGCNKPGEPVAPMTWASGFIDDMYAPVRKPRRHTQILAYA